MAALYVWQQSPAAGERVGASVTSYLNLDVYAWVLGPRGAYAGSYNHPQALKICTATLDC